MNDWKKNVNKKEESHNGAVDTKTRQKKYFIESRTVYHHRYRKICTGRAGHLSQRKRIRRTDEGTQKTW